MLKAHRNLTMSALIRMLPHLGLITAVGMFSSYSATAASATQHDTYNSLTRSEFNRHAALQFLPLFWREDANKDGIIQPDELAVLWGFGNSPDEKQRSHWVDAQQHFTPQFAAAYHRMTQTAAPHGDAHEQQRLQLVQEELSQGAPTLVLTDLSHGSAADVNMVRHMMSAAKALEKIYAQQKGVLSFAHQIPAHDTASLMLFYRNQSPFCDSPKTQGNPACSALTNKTSRTVGLYPATLQSDKGFCEKLASADNAKQLMDHFSVVTTGSRPGSYTTVPYNQAYKDGMTQVANELVLAANGLGKNEAAFKNYLLSAAASFRSNDWEPANRAWVAMNANNSKWYARIAPDEVYYEPCAWKAGFALQLAHINPDSIEWQKKLGPLKQDMEQVIATMAGAPYQVREVQFKLPDFIDVVLNAGDQRSPTGATIGQSLPNWGPVAESSGRTVAMTNLYTDTDSQARLAESVAAEFCSATNQQSTTSGTETLITSLLHEAAHNLGPTHEYRLAGKTDVEAFGGPLSSTLEELKAQTSAMFFTDWLTQKNVLTAQQAQQIHLRDLAWEIGHISRGMYTPDGTPRNYSQLAAIQLGAFIKDGAVMWKKDEVAANGKDQGCLEVDFDKLPASIQSLETTVLKIKAQNDKVTAEQLRAEFVDGKDEFANIKNELAARWQRAPKATFVYSIVF